MSRKSSAVAAALAAAAAMLLTLVPAASGAKPTGPKNASGGSIALVLLDSTDGVAHWGQQVRFDVETTATEFPRVDLSCSQAGTRVYFAQTGYWDGYAWPWTQTFTLQSGSWSGGAADCTAVLYKLTNNGRRTDLARLAFHVEA